MIGPNTNHHILSDLTQVDAEQTNITNAVLPLTQRSDNDTFHTGRPVVLELSDTGLSFTTSVISDTTSSTTLDAMQHTNRTVAKLTRKIDRLHAKLPQTLAHIQSTVHATMTAAISDRTTLVLQTLDRVMALAVQEFTREVDSQTNAVQKLYDDFYDTVEDEVRTNITNPLRQEMEEHLRKFERDNIELDEVLTSIRKEVDTVNQQLQQVRQEVGTHHQLMQQGVY